MYIKIFIINTREQLQNYVIALLYEEKNWLEKLKEQLYCKNDRYVLI